MPSVKNNLLILSLTALLVCWLGFGSSAYAKAKGPDEGGIGGTGIHDAPDVELFEAPELIDGVEDLAPELPEITVPDIELPAIDAPEFDGSDVLDTDDMVEPPESPSVE